MSLFIAYAALLALLAISFVVLPLLHDPQAKTRRFLRQGHQSGLLSDAEYQTKLAALQQNGGSGSNAPHRTTALLLGIALPVFAVLLYQKIGTPEAIGLQQAGSVNPSDVANTALAEDNLDQLREALRRNPDNLQGWMQLAQSYREAQRFSDAADAFAVVIEGLPDQAPVKPDILTNYAESLMFASNTPVVPPAAKAAIQQALTLNPQHQRALWLSGVSAYQDGNFHTAITTWQTLLPLLQDSSIRDSIEQQIAQAKIEAGDITAGEIMQSSHADPGISTSTPERPSPIILADVTVNDELIQQLDNRSPVLFVFARLTDSDRPPLAIQRIVNPQFPLQVQLDESSAMIPGQSLAVLELNDSLTVTARLSFNGNAIAEPGDWQGRLSLSLEQAVNQSPLAIIITDIL